MESNNEPQVVGFKYFVCVRLLFGRLVKKSSCETNGQLSRRLLIFFLFSIFLLTIIRKLRKKTATARKKGFLRCKLSVSEERTKTPLVSIRNKSKGVDLFRIYNNAVLVMKAGRAVSGLFAM